MKENGKVLIVDDEPDIRLLLNRRLTANRFEVLEASDGSLGVEAARRHLPDVVLLDVMMPGQDGIETYHALKQDPATRHIPVILLTVMAQKVQLTKYVLGLDRSFAILEKPYRPEELIEMVRRALQERVS